jgi:hypothetical protein
LLEKFAGGHPDFMFLSIIDKKARLAKKGKKKENKRE